MSSVIPIDRGRRGDRAVRRRGEYALLQAALPGQRVRNAGVLLLDPETGHLYAKIREHWEEVTDPQDRQLLSHLEEDFQLQIRETGGAEFLRSLEDTLSNTLRLTAREPVAVTEFPRTLERLYQEHVEPVEIRRFVTHLPLYSLQAAATKFGEEREVEEEGWVPAPAGLRLTPDMFVARVVGRSMEPRIPDGSLCLFRSHVAGSRQGKLVLVERFGATETSARYTIKKYTSKKIYTGEEEWRHASVRLEPLNPEFEGFQLKEGESRVIAEFVQVLD